MHSKTDTDRNEYIFRISKEMLGYTNIVLSGEIIRRISSNSVVYAATNGVEEWLFTLNNQKIIVMRKKLERN